MFKNHGSSSCILIFNTHLKNKRLKKSGRKVYAFPILNIMPGFPSRRKSLLKIKGALLIPVPHKAGGL